MTTTRRQQKAPQMATCSQCGAPGPLRHSMSLKPAGDVVAECCSAKCLAAWRDSHEAEIAVWQEWYSQTIFLSHLPYIVQCRWNSKRITNSDHNEQNHPFYLRGSSPSSILALINK